MIKTIIFDFGDVFINLDKKGAMQNALNIFRLEAFSKEMTFTNEQYEQGFISTESFIQFYSQTFPKLSREIIVDAWNFIIKDFPKHRLHWVQELSKNDSYKLILLSNTNELHIDYIKEHIDFYNDFKSCFDMFYLSHEIGLRKPNSNIYEFVLEKNNLNADECFFIDDTKENTDIAKTLGINCWNIDETQEDVTELFTINKHLF